MKKLSREEEGHTQGLPHHLKEETSTEREEAIEGVMRDTRGMRNIEDAILLQSPVNLNTRVKRLKKTEESMKNVESPQ